MSTLVADLLVFKFWGSLPFVVLMMLSNVESFTVSSCNLSVQFTTRCMCRPWNWHLLSAWPMCQMTIEGLWLTNAEIQVVASFWLSFNSVYMSYGVKKVYVEYWRFTLGCRLKPSTVA